MVELRVALALRGGVSLAIWMGGACAEIDTMRRARPANDQAGGDAPGGGRPTGAAAAAFWGPLLEVAGYDAVRIDVLAGASAGGLNSVLLATAVKYGITFDVFRDLWLDVGDLRKLVRGTDEREPRSLLKGDAHFLVTMEDILARCLADRAPNTSYLDVSLTGTILDALSTVTVDELGTPVLEPSHRAAFRFRANRGTTDFPRAADHVDPSTGEPVRSQETLNRGLAAKLALAARATSSFPGAFEPARVHVRRPDAAGGQLGRRSPALDGAGNLFGQFSDATRTHYNVIDGGVLDNIPVTRAIHAVAAAPAAFATRRVLLYLDPNPRVTRADAEPETATDLLSTLSGASAAQGTAESILDDLEEFRRHNDVAARYRALQRSITTQLAAAGSAPLPAAALHASNEQRATLEARRIRALLQDPTGALGEDPFPEAGQAAPLLRPPPRSDAPYRPLLDPDALDDLERALGRELVARLPSALDQPTTVRLLGYPALTRSGMALLEVARADEQQGADRGELKDRLYAVQGVAALLEHIGELFWPVHAAAEEPRPDGDGSWTTWVTRALEQREELLAAMGAREPAPAEASGPHATYRWLHAEVIRLRRGAPALEVEGDLRDLVGNELVAVAEALAADPVAGTDAPLRPVLERCDDVAYALLVHEVATQPLQTVSPRPPLPIELMRVSSAVRSPAADRLFGGRRLTVQTKLTGNAVMNFAAFYKASWRANDWMWGRLDAAAALVNLLVRPGELARRYGPADVATLLARFESATRSVPAGSAFDRPGVETGEWQARLDRLWASRAADIRAELTDLFARGAAHQRLDVLRDTLTERRQLELLCAELPTVIHTATADQLDVANRALNEAERHESLLVHTARTAVDAHQRVATPERLEALCAEYAVGAEELRDEVGRAGFTELLAHLLLVAWRAIGVSTRVPGFLRPFGVMVQAVRGTAVGVVRAPRWAVATVPVVATLALVAVLRGGLGPFGRATATAVLLGVAVTVALPVARARWLRAAAAAAALAVGGFLGGRSWANRGALSEQLAGIGLPGWLHGSPTTRAVQVVASVLVGAAVVLAYQRWPRAGAPPARGRSTPHRVWPPALLLTTGVVAAVSYGFRDRTDPWVAQHVDAASVAAVAAGTAAVLVAVAAAIVAVRLSPLLCVAALAGAGTMALMVRPPETVAQLAAAVALAGTAVAIGAYHAAGGRVGRGAPTPRRRRRSRPASSPGE